VECWFLTRDQALSLGSGTTDTKTLDYRGNNPREDQMMRTHTKESTWTRDPHDPTTSSLGKGDLKHNKLKKEKLMKRREILHK